MNSKQNYILEVSWEICNKVGGIYTVIMSKAALINENYENYLLIGPYFKKKAENEFIEESAPVELDQVFETLCKLGIRCHYGTWQIKGKPKIILIDVSKYKLDFNQTKKELWDNFKVDSLNSSRDFDEVTIWSKAAGIFIETFSKNLKKNKKINIVAHFHEWLTGAALLHLKKNCCQVSTVFTTHATILGRTIAGSSRKLYEELKLINPEEEAKKYNINDKFSIEKACAQNSDVFTTVSEITSIEAKHLLGRKADVLLLNGLDIGKLPTYEEVAIRHRTCRNKLREFLRYYFSPYYYLDTKKTLIFFIVGRYEYKNKGIDLVIDGLAKLNEKLKKENPEINIVCLFWIPREIQGVRAEISASKVAIDRIDHLIKDNFDDITTNLLNNTLQLNTKSINSENITKEIISEAFIFKMKKLTLSLNKKGTPPLSTHNIPNENNDAIINAFISKGLTNKEEDPVKVIFYPIYLSGIDGLADLNYYDAMTACHLGLFPSYYEPWGYTPLECAALGVPSLTTDLSGFGRFLQKKTNVNEGIFIIKRMNQNPDDVLASFSDILYKFSKFNLKERVQQKMIAKDISNIADWKKLIINYFAAHKLAIERFENSNT